METFDEDPYVLLHKARAGDRHAREEFTRRFTPFVLRVASESVGRYVALGQDDESSIALMAFNEAIDQYDPGQETNFLTFAETVIKRRLIDYLRRETRRRQREFLISPEKTEEGYPDSFPVSLQERQAVEIFNRQQEASERKEEIALFKKRLEEFGISLPDLARSSPRHKSARRRAMEAARILAEEDSLRESFLRHKMLPLKELEIRTRFSRKTLERHRRYIIAIALIYVDEFPYLKEYLKETDSTVERG
ncbi:RNA polymerase sigma-I factor [Calderihabitans maritimus]|uniref:RNA polymerase sigma factor SigI n=1 Tax=Calderihabitans maritimus TaxID=1246530 RepID=A0A1Z5HTW0_9FIRM|nr:RNA polymerase sigma-I factor [Calderihabitans maritimus]GAW92710.1 FliA/WhiG subfamily RNA polymerase sigma-28 subunit [Calderihabitans maritimus]